VRALLLCLVLTLAACGTLAPGADRVIVTRDPGQVADCVIVGTVSSDASALAGDWNGEGWYKLRNQASALHADRVLLTSSRLAPDAGTAYHCGGR
jgi:hypothetical protein